MMTTRITVTLAAFALVAGCAGLPGPQYGEQAAPVETAGVPETARYGKVAALETIKVDKEARFGVGTVVGAVAGGLLGHQFGGGSGKTLLTIGGALAGAAAGTAAESKLDQKDAQKVTVDMQTGGRLTIVQPPDSRLKTGMPVRVTGSGETARVVPR